MDLFDFAHRGDEVPMGFRLQRLEVYNWGTFDEKVWSLELHGDTSLLTGDVGSGKSTLVDAIITLLVPPKKVTYNKAADASAKERSLTSYVRGYFAQKRTEDGGGQPEALRGRDQYSVLLAVFGDENLGGRVTLAQVFWFRDENNWPARFYVLADKTLSIQNHFSNFGTDMRNLKKRLDSDSYIHLYDDYPAYARDFRRRFGIRQDQAMDLFQQTISMKKVDELTGFVRQNMLEKPDTETDVQILLEHFRDLDEAHSTVVRAREQQELLRPLVNCGDSYFQFYDRDVQLAQMEAALPAWFASQDCQLRQRECENLERAKTAAEKEAAAILAEAKRNETALEETKQAIWENGGSQLALLESQLTTNRNTLAQRQSSSAHYKEQAAVLKMPVPESEADFRENQQALVDLLTEAANREEEIADARADAESGSKALDKAGKAAQAELDSLRQRKSSIPAEYIAIRQELCASLNLAEGEIPFAGELMEVREEESEWEGALERLLHGFGISLLVPEAHYGEVIDWMEHHALHQHMVYYKVEAYTEPVELSRLPEDAACRKLSLREDAPVYNWLANELAQRFRHICCESLTDFRREKFALTQAGQIKVKGRRHEKDDRFRLDDRRRYVLGFSNLRKIQAIEDELRDIAEEQKENQREIRRLKDALRLNNQRRTAGQLLQQVEGFAVIDWQSVAAEIAEQERVIAELKNNSDILHALEDKKRELEQQREKLAAERQARQTTITRAQDRLDSHRRHLQEDEMVIGRLEEKARQTVWPRIAEKFSMVLPNEAPGLYSLTNQQERYREALREERAANQKQLTGQGELLVQQMTGYVARYPEQAKELDTRPGELERYRELLTRLEVDALPKFESKFRELLRENTIRQIALFQEKLNTACDIIRERITMINGSLAAIAYNEGRYIQLECNEAPDHAVKEFRTQLRACTDNALTGSEEDTYSEAKFGQVEAIVERFRGRAGHTDEDAKWTKRVIDVRNWFTFAASERWRETDEEYEHYTDSGGKSGGQKEKLAYTILAASLVYNFGLEARHRRHETFRFVVIDEAFLKSSDDSARFGLELFQKLDLQLLVVTPLLKIATIEPFVTHVGFVYQKDEEHRSFLRNLTIEELQEERTAYEQQQ